MSLLKNQEIGYYETILLILMKDRLSI